ncbi:MAG TPA: DUF2934 domain-containing protein [Nitrospira sp.]|nr:DUF2934 domain-containing protein [Nitrospira sp.]
MQPHMGKELRKRKSPQAIRGGEPAGPEREPVHCQPVSPCDDLYVRIVTRAYELHAKRGYRQGYALDDWLEAEREILGFECNA